MVLAHAYRLAGRYEDAIAVSQSALDLPRPYHLVKFRNRLTLTISYSELDHIDEAKAEAAEILKLVPNFSVEVYGERVPYRDPAQAERDMAALRKAGLE